MAEPRPDAAAGLLSDLLRGLVRDVADYPEPGVVFKDIAPVLADRAAFAAVVDAMVGRVGAGQVDSVVGIEARGFILGAPVAYHAGAGFVPARKKGKLPGPTLDSAYELEYGSAVLSLQADAVLPGERVLVVDDVLATGGTAAAAVDLVTRMGAIVVGVSVLIDLTFLHGPDRLP
ncbi:MAG: adenine phosphoribosyltransferase, partial [Actinomycetes bacterium]